jgi:hypothetical protein
VGKLATTATEPNTLAMCPLNAYNPWAMSLYLKKKGNFTIKEGVKCISKRKELPS